MYSKKNCEELMVLAEEYLAINKDDEALDVCRHLMHRNYDHVQDVYCKYLAKAGRVDDALRFLEGRQRTFRDRFYKSVDTEGTYLLSKTAKQIEDFNAHKLMSIAE